MPPIYELECPKCKCIEEIMCKYDHKEDVMCPHCNPFVTMNRIISDCNFILNGGGWYSFTKGKKNPGVK